MYVRRPPLKLKVNQGVAVQNPPKNPFGQLDRKITLVGTMRANRVGVQEMKDVTGREVFSTKVFWEKNKQKMTIYSYCTKTKSKGRKIVNVLPTIPPILGVTDDDKRKPAIVKFYDFTKVCQINNWKGLREKRVGWTKKFSLKSFPYFDIAFFINFINKVNIYVQQILLGIMKRLIS